MTARREGDWIELDFPALPVGPTPAPLDELARALNAPVRFAAFNRFDCLAEVDSEETVRSLAPDIRRLTAMPVRGIIVTSRGATPGFDFVSRFFAPRLGVDEDPVCGSAHCCLGPFWSARLGKPNVVGYQASARGGCGPGPGPGTSGLSRRPGRNGPSRGTQRMRMIPRTVRPRRPLDSTAMTRCLSRTPPGKHGTS